MNLLSIFYLISLFLLLFFENLDNVEMLLANNPEIFKYTVPVGELLRTELYPFTRELTCSVLASVIDKVVTLTQVLSMGDNHTLVKHIIKILCYPLHLIRPCGWVLPRGSGEDDKS